MTLQTKYVLTGIVIGLLVGAGAGYIYGQSPIAGYKEEVDRLKTENLGIREKKAQLLEENTALQYQLEVVTTNLSSTRSSLDLALGKLSKSEEDYEELEKEKEEEIENLIMQLETLNETYQNLILTYSSKFVISDLVINIDEVEINQPVKISVTVKNIGGLEGSYNLQLKIGDVIEASKELTLMGGESITTSFDLTKDEVGIYNFTLNGLSGTFNVIRPLWCEIGVPYVAADGLTVTLTSLEIKEKTGSYQYTIWYTLKNEQPNEVIDEGSFKMYYANESGGLPQYGFFNKLFSGDSITRTYTFEELKSKPFGVLEYHHENFFSSEPLEDSLKWKVELANFVRQHVWVSPVDVTASGYTIWGVTWYTGPPRLAIDGNKITAWTLNDMGEITFDLGSERVVGGIEAYWGGHVTNGNTVNVYVDGKQVLSNEQFGAASNIRYFTLVRGRFVKYQTIALPHNEYLQIATWSEIAEFKVLVEEG